MIPLAPLAASLPATVPFTGPEALERRMGRPFLARLGANESAFGPSPQAVEAIEGAARDAWMYGDPEAFELREAVADAHGLPPAHVALGQGIDGLLGLLVRLTVAPGTPVVTAQGAYPTFDYHVAGFGGHLLRVPREDRIDPLALARRAREAGARLLYLSSPDNPMGHQHDAALIPRLLDALPPACLLLLDEAYAELAPDGSLPRLDPADDRAVRLRTFSKAHGLAGLRVGYALGPAPLLAALDRVRDHFGLGRVAQEGALAAIRDRAWPLLVRDRVARGRARIEAIARDAGLAPLPSAANFVLLDCGEAAVADRLLAALARRGVFARKPLVAPIARCLRVTVGPDEALDALAAALPPALAEARLPGAGPLTTSGGHP